jgi:hypothetical protein
MPGRESVSSRRTLTQKKKCAALVSPDKGLEARGYGENAELVLDFKVTE